MNEDKNKQYEEFNQPRTGVRFESMRSEGQGESESEIERRESSSS